MSIFLYNLFVFFYQIAIRLVSPFNGKARLWLIGRRFWASRLEKLLDQHHFTPTDTVLWMHASSLGEFEQGRPLLEALRQQNPAIKIVLTFFSPSGYEATKNYKGADIVFYLPADTASNANRFLKMVQPSLVLWVKYEYWFYHLQAISQRQIPLLMVSGVYRSLQPFFKKWGSLHRQMLSFFTHFFVQNQDSATLLKTVVDARKITESGDTRFDRVLAIAENWYPEPLVESWINNASNVLVAGSTWPEDEEELMHYAKANPEIQLILAPHHIEADMLTDTLKLFPGATLFSDLLEGKQQNKASNVLIINNIGMLSRLYKYGRICYIGGGFTGDGIHNVLEAAVYGKPVVHGPEYEKYNEAVELLNAGASFEFESAVELETILARLFSNHSDYEKAAAAACNYVQSKAGSTAQILEFIYANRLLTRR